MDMQIPPHYQRRYPKFVTHLPIIYKDFPQAFRHTEKPWMFYNLTNTFGGIFDAAALGQWVSGVDPRNIKGDSRCYSNPDAMFPVHFAGLINFTKCKEGYRVPILHAGNKKYRIFNLHIHHKNLRTYMDYNDDNAICR